MAISIESEDIEIEKSLIETETKLNIRKRCETRKEERRQNNYAELGNNEHWKREKGNRESGKQGNKEQMNFRNTPLTLNSEPRAPPMGHKISTGKMHLFNVIIVMANGRKTVLNQKIKRSDTLIVGE